MSVEVTNQPAERYLVDACHRRQVTLHCRQGQPAGRRPRGVGVADHDDVPPNRWLTAFDLVRVAAVGFAAGLVVAFGSPGTLLACCGVGLLFISCDWRAMTHRIHRDWTSWRRQGRHRAARGAPRFHPA